MPGFAHAAPENGWFLAAVLVLICGGAGLQAQAPPPVTLSASLSTDRPEAILFPGNSVGLELESAVHPNEPANWDSLQIRLAAAGLPEGQGRVPVKITTRLPRGGTLALVANKWYFAKELGLSPAKPSLKISVEHQAFTREPLLLTGEVQSPRAAFPAASARFPVSCAGFELTDIADPAEPKDDQSIEDGDTALLTHLNDANRPLPVMPRLVARIQGLPKSYAVRWRFTCRYPKRGDLDAVAFPPKGTTELPASEPWRIFNAYFGHFFGGNASVSFDVSAPDGKSIYRGSRSFRILSKNAADPVTREYIKSRSGEFWYAWAIAQHESRQWKDVYNQFNVRGKALEEPNFGPPDGWGVFQIDSARGQTVSTREVWDLRENVFAGLDELQTAKEDSRRYIEAIKRTYPNSYDGLPPSYTPPGCHTTLTWEEASIIELFNGAAVVIKLKNPHGTYSFYRSCWRFLPHNPPGKRWVFVRNRNNYVYKVVRHEIEGEMDTSP